MKNLKVGDTLMFKFSGYEPGGIMINDVFRNELKCFASAIRNRKSLNFYFHGYVRLPEADPKYDINGNLLKPGELCKRRFDAFVKYLGEFGIESSRFTYVEGPLNIGIIVRKPFETDDWFDISKYSFLTVKEL
jgi:hypothetical protein